MTPTAINACDRHAHLSRLYEQGRYRDVVEAASGLDVPAGAEGEHNVKLGRAILFAGRAHRELNELPAAESRLLLALRLLGTNGERPQPAYLSGLHELGYLYEQMGRHDQAEALYRRAQDAYARDPGADPEGHAQCLQALSGLYHLLGRRRQAVEALREAQDIRAQALGKGHAEYAWGLLSEAWMSFRIGKSLGAEAQVRQALKVLRAAHGERHPTYASALQTAGRVLLAFSHLDEAEAMLTQGGDVRREVLGETHPLYACSLEALAQLKLVRYQPQEAEVLARRALEITRSAVGEARSETAWDLGTLGRALMAQWKLVEGEECHRQAYAIVRAALGEGNPAVAGTLIDLATMLAHAGRVGEAEEALREALVKLEPSGPDGAWERVEVRVELAQLLLGQGQTEEASRLLRQAEEEAASFGGTDPFVLVPACLLRVRMFQAAGQSAAAAQQARRAEALVRPLPAHHALTIDAAYARMECTLGAGDLHGTVRIGEESARAVVRGLGETYPSHAQLLRYIATLRHQEGKFEESERLFERALALFRRHLGQEHLEVAETLRGMSWLYLARNNVPAAESRLRQACDIRRAVLGEQHPGYAEGLKDLAIMHLQARNLLASDMYYRQAIDVLRVNPGEDHPDYAMALQGRASVLHAVGELTEAEKLLQQALRILRADTDTPDPRCLDVRRSLALVCASRSDFLRAEELLQQSLAGQERRLGRDNEGLVPTLTDLGRVYEAMGDLVAAGPVLERVRAINARAHGEGSAAGAFDRVTAANLARLKGDYDRADAQARQALSIATALLPPDHPQLVDFLVPLALVCHARRSFHEAEQLLDRALSLTVAALGPRHPCVAFRQGDLAAVYAASGRPAEATRLLEQAADLLRASQGEDHPDHAAARRALGLHCHALREYDRGEKALRKALEVTRRTGGENHPAVAGAHRDLAELYRSRNDLAAAAEQYREALEVLRRGEAPCDALHATLLHGQALVLLQQGRAADAEPLLRAALDIDRSAGDDATFGHLESVLTLAQLVAADDRDDVATLLFRKVLESAIRLTPSFCCLRHDGSPVPFWGQLWDLSEMLLTLGTRGPGDPSTVRFLFDLVLRVKGLGPSGMVLAERGRVLREHPELRERLETRFVLGRQAAGRAAAGAGPEGLETDRRLLARWQQQRESLESDLERTIPALARQRRWLTLDARAVSAALPPECLLVEYVRYHPRDFAGLCVGKEEKRPACYLAFLLHAARPEEVRLIDLGEAAPIDRLARAACSLFGGRQAREALADRILAPLSSHLENCRHAVIAASGALGRVRFSDVSNAVAVRQQITTARELLDLPAAVNAERGRGWIARLLDWLCRWG
jgi:tetratricopeptide (TPR) repeat protein